MSETLLNTIPTILNSLVIITGLFMGKKTINLWISKSNERYAILAMDQKKNENRLKDLESGHVFRQSFENKISNQVSFKISNSENLSNNKILSEALMNFGNGLIEFAMSFYYSDFRFNKELPTNEFKNYLYNKINVQYTKIVNECGKINLEKVTKVNNKFYPIHFSELLTSETIQEPSIFTQRDKLIDRLLQNGINESEMFNIFVNYTDNMINEIRNKYNKYKELKSLEESDV